MQAITDADRKIRVDSTTTFLKLLEESHDMVGAPIYFRFAVPLVLRVPAPIDVTPFPNELVHQPDPSWTTEVSDRDIESAFPLNARRRKIEALMKPPSAPVPKPFVKATSNISDKQSFEARCQPAVTERIFGAADITPRFSNVLYSRSANCFGDVAFPLMKHGDTIQSAVSDVEQYR